MDELAVLVGSDRALALGQVGLYAEAGSVHTEIAYDDVDMAVLSEPVSVKDSTWSEIKSRFK